MLYPTASEDPGEELLTWEPQDDLEFDDDFQLTKRTKSIITDLVASKPTKGKLKFTKHGVPCDDSDSDLEDFHHILDQSDLQLKLADQSLKKKRKDPMGTGLHPDPAKYKEIIDTCVTNIQCLQSICQHLSTEDVMQEDVTRVQDLMTQWQKLEALASDRFDQSSQLSKVRDQLSIMSRCVKGAEDCLALDRFGSVDELKETIRQLKQKRQTLDLQQEQISELEKHLKGLSLTYPSLYVDKYAQELAALGKLTAVTSHKLKESVGQLENNWSVWLEYIEGQRELDAFLASDRERVYSLLCQRERGLRLTKKDVLKELETLQSNVSVCESKLSVLQEMRARLLRTSDDSAQRVFMASLGDLRNQLHVMSERCREVYRDMDDEDELPASHQSDLGDLAISAATLHEAFRNPHDVGSSLSKRLAASPLEEASTGMSRSSASWLRSLPVQVVTLVLVAGLVCALDPDILERLANFSLTVTPELHYVDGPPTV
ncbi:uncharacterized protein LOC101852145 [Aplysia californica]|uniref:Uncharacterized protein LOC101852145 n=1 Tax=Aplysia californica TaxID=6500 RepID=A0ABM1AEZ5_APLCA|nr:uncharacterized protein LOC101852145 [Aplysia californica]